MQQIVIGENWQFRKKGDEAWLSAEVPGAVHTDLLNNKKIKDPFFRLNEKDVQWIENEDWEYRCEIQVEPSFSEADCTELVFKGIDTYSLITLNGQLLGKTDNMFVEWRYPCKGILKKGLNHLEVLLKSPIKEAMPLFKAADFEYPANNDEGDFRVSSHTRKSPYQYGWDWGPRLVTSGMWRPVEIQSWNKAVIRNVHVIQDSLNKEQARIKINIIIESIDSYDGVLEIAINKKKYSDFCASLEKGMNTIETELSISNPELWWTNGLGDAVLYDLGLTLIHAGNKIDFAKTRFGLRTVELIREKDEKGTGFYFKVNGFPVFMKGANIIPGDCFPSRVKKETYNQLIQDAVSVHMNMLRVWGGGIYEDDTFYDLCDEHGILVWQDFMFACGMYPATEEFLSTVRKEAEYNIQRIRNHPCIALWCGNNEILEGFHAWGWKEKLGEKNAEKAFREYEQIFYELIPEILRTSDPSRSYWPSSPSSDYAEKLSLTSGDYHFWDIVKSDLPIAVYRDHVGRFMSEYGFKSYPELKTLKTYSIESDWDIRSAVLESHQGWVTGADLVEKNLLREYRKPKNFESFLYVSQLLQAEAIKIAVEAHRGMKPYCMGSLYWQLNDCWPCASWSSIDYFGRWKAIHYKLKNLYHSIYAIAVEIRELLVVRLLSDEITEQDAAVHCKIIDFSGKIIWQENKIKKIKANTNQIFAEIPINTILSGQSRKDILFSITIQKGEEIISGNIYYFNSPKYLNLPTPKIETSYKKIKEGTDILLKTDKLAKNVYLSSETEGFFSDNYFDLLPGETKKIKFSTKEASNDLKKEIKIISLIDTY